MGPPTRPPYSYVVMTRLRNRYFEQIARQREVIGDPFVRFPCRSRAPAP